uniref:Uncharacterized protein n=1 Tax=Pristionchus pacificus TaxID=54126 RepID=A0A2A6BRS9_PRIPA|eukprot:PDM68526.1 hypothetical protein PRIPAC_44028 [Pristionchus pacificus]
MRQLRLQQIINTTIAVGVDLLATLPSRIGMMVRLLNVTLAEFEEVRRVVPVDAHHRMESTRKNAAPGNSGRQERDAREQKTRGVE